jgi:hypothetical protein
MTELLAEPIEVQLAPDGRIQALCLPEGWRPVARTPGHWRVETDWWREPVERDYRRCITRTGECVEVYLDLRTGTWHLARRYD